ncbi:MAG TPA: protein translocase subunit SecF, partial [Candidatus Altiarchaeales archaeon]|nr:protein translocase subunit SecF [Candidatus Altiarchaeales archaeon]
ILIILVIFIAFRDFVPSIAVILAATFDALFAAGGMSLFGITLEPASLVAIIMLVGYSVDTDILLTTRVLKTRTGTVNERIDNAMKTGLTMTTTTLCVMFVILIISTQVIKIDIMADISSVLLVGLIGDIISTWFMNAGILKWYMEEKGGKIRIRRVRI